MWGGKSAGGRGAGGRAACGREGCVREERVWGWRAACGEERRPQGPGGRASAAPRQPRHTAPPNTPPPPKGLGHGCVWEAGPRDPEDTHTQWVEKGGTQVSVLNLRRMGCSSRPQTQHGLASSHSGPLSKGDACISLGAHRPRSSGQAPSGACVPCGGARLGIQPCSGPPPMALRARGRGYPRSYLVTGRASPGQAMTPAPGNTGRAAS